MTLKRQLISGIKWTTVTILGRSLFQLFQISILTRFLPKEAFGLMAMALFVINFSNIFIDMGLGAAILHRQNSTAKELSSIYWLNIFISVLLYFLIFLSAPLISSFYKEPELITLIPILGINLILLATGQQQRTLMQKEFKFKEIAYIELISFFAGFILAVGLALRSFGVYSLVYSTLFASFISNTLFLIFNLKYKRVLFHFRLKDTKPFLSIGGFSLGSSLLNFFSSEADILIVGRMFGTESLGVYSLSKQIVMKLYTIVNPIVTSVLNPVLASIQTNKEQVKRYYLKIISILSTINLPIYFLIIILSKEILTLMYGVDYFIGYLILSFLSISSCTNTIGNPVGSLYISTGRTDIAFKWTLIRAIVTPIAIYLASKESINFVAATIAGISVALIVPAWWVQLKPMANIGFKEYLEQFIKPYVLFVFLSCLFLISLNYFDFSFGVFVNAVLKGSIGLIIFFGLLLIIDRERILDIKEIVKIK